jgi:signal transduction histidine kinase
MRRPIRLQLLVPMLTVVVLAIAMASAASAYLGAVRARQVQRESLARVVAVLAEAKFPRSEPVLRLMSGLSGAEFVFLDSRDRVESSTLPLDPATLEPLRRLPLPRGAAKSGLATGERIELAGKTYLGCRVPIRSRGPTDEDGSFVVLYSEELGSAVMRQAAYPALAAGGLAVLAVVVVTTLLAARFAARIRRLGNQTAAIARGDFTPVAVGPHSDELRDLAVSINRMTERLGQYEREVRRSEQLHTLGRLGAGLAHQLRNAATGGRMAIELHQRECSLPAPRESLDVALRQLRLMESYLQRFLTLSRPRDARREPVSLVELLDDVAALVQPACRHADIELTLEKPAADISVLGDAEELRQLILNLVLNAVDATSGHGHRPATILLSLEPLAADRAALCVADSGPGPAEDVRQRLFEPFVTDKPEGTGLGLFVARQIAEAHQGSLRFERRGEQTRFTLELPRLA